MIIPSFTHCLLPSPLGHRRLGGETCVFSPPSDAHLPAQCPIHRVPLTESLEGVRVGALSRSPELTALQPQLHPQAQSCCVTLGEPCPLTGPELLHLGKGASRLLAGHSDLRVRKTAIRGRCDPRPHRGDRTAPVPISGRWRWRSWGMGRPWQHGVSSRALDGQRWTRAPLQTPGGSGSRSSLVIFQPRCLGSHHSSIITWRAGIVPR